MTPLDNTLRRDIIRGGSVVAGVYVILQTVLMFVIQVMAAPSKGIDGHTLTALTNQTRLLQEITDTQHQMVRLLEGSAGERAAIVDGLGILSRDVRAVRDNLITLDDIRREFKKHEQRIHNGG